MIARRTILLAALLMIVCASSLPVLAQETNGRIIVYDGQLFALLAGIAESSKVNIGFEAAPGPSTTKIKLECHNLDACLDGIVAANPRYQWRKKDGFIDIFPREGASQILDIEISEFQSENNDWLSVTEALTTLPEVQRQIQELGFTRCVLPIRRSAMTLFSVKLQNVTLRRALHEITKSNNGNSWMFEQYGAGRNRTFSINNGSF